ncbi:hypothetical protein [Cupriavidus sp. AU9028]|uniref:hypothetical protein n=1 Tax=Cupriavidus sp. AU9028 TaxID=2871157 RepID=UPI001C969DE9|nr:hypothetical protein [Cupriavidus sp. AU9028]MBY4899349.1 hypothetical protein [Cupriavidus sp. AU9028]
MSVSPISHHHHVAPAAPQAASAGEEERVADAARTAHGQPGQLDLLHAAKRYRELAAELARRSQDSGNYERVTLTDSEIKSLADAGVPIDRFLKEYGQKLGSRECIALSDLVLRTLEKQGSAQADGVTLAAMPERLPFVPTDISWMQDLKDKVNQLQVPQVRLPLKPYI